MNNERVIAVINSKGGVGKTSITANVGGVIARQPDTRVLLVDLDPQGNLAEDLGFTGTSVDDGGRALAFGLPITPVVNIRSNLDVIPGGEELDAATNTLTGKMMKDPRGAKNALARVLAPLLDSYDLVLIDCPPGQAPLQQAALAAARWALIPVKTDASSRKGLRDVALRLDSVIDVNNDLDLLGVVLFGVNKTAHRVLDQARQAIVDDFDGDQTRVLTTTIRHAEAAAQEAREHGKLAHELDEAVKQGPKFWERLQGVTDDGPRSKSAVGLADDFHALSGEILQRIAAAEAPLEAPPGESSDGTANAPASTDSSGGVR